MAYCELLTKSGEAKATTDFHGLSGSVFYSNKKAKIIAN
jgi:hypothetical protein